jgi:hypothetical protein
MNFILSYRNFHFLPNDFDLDYADDIVLLSHNFRDMQEKVDHLVEESQKEDQHREDQGSPRKQQNNEGF